MGQVFAEITVKNADDIVKVRQGQLDEKDVRTVTLNALVDTGATTLVINEEICQQLGLGITATKMANLAGGGRGWCKLTQPVQIQWKDRQVTVESVVFPEGKPLLGVVPLEMMDLIVDPTRRELVGAHGDEVYFMAM